MTILQRLQLEQSKKRERINALLAIEERSEEENTEMQELTTRLQALEPELRAAIVAEGVEDPETRGIEDPETVELRGLIDRASIAGVFKATIEHRAAEGETAELQQHYGLQSNQIPLALLRDSEVEERAVTPAPANVGQNQSAIIPGVFPMSCAAFLGVDIPTVGVGEAVFPVLTKNAEVRTPAENAEATDTTGSFNADVLSPSRLQAAFFYSREDRARFQGMDEALRMNLSDALSDALDKEILAGTNGLLTGTNLANNNVNAATDFGAYKSELAFSRVDGKYAMSTMDLRIVVGSGTYAHAATVYRANNADDSALDVLMARTSGVKVSSHVPAVSASKQNAVIRLGMRRDMVAPVWEGITLISDEVTKAANGQIVITAVMLYAAKILRADGFHKQQTQHA